MILKTKENKKEKELIKPEPFEFKPIGKITPTIYIPVIYLVLVVALLSYLFLLPGATSSYAQVQFTSSPDKLGVFVDDTLIGFTPFSARVKAGEHTLTFKRQGFETQTKTIKIKRKIFNNRFAPAHYSFKQILHPKEDKRILTSYLKDYYLHGIEGEGTQIFDKSNPVPLPLSDLARIISSEENQQENQQESQQENHKKTVLTTENLLQGLSLAIGYTTTRYQLTDWLTAFYVASSHANGLHRQPSQIVTLEGLTQMVTALVPALVKNPPLAQQLNSIAPPYLQDRLTALIKIEEKKETLPPVQPLPNNNFTINGTQFIAFQTVKGKKVWFGQTEVTQAQFYQFIQEKKEYSLDNYQATLDQRTDLIQDVNDKQQYLADWIEGRPLSDSQNIPVRYLNWEVAHAYTQWFTAKYLKNRNLKASLPSGLEWATIAKDNSDKEMISPLLNNNLTLDPPSVKEYSKGKSGLGGLIGGVWEWCSNEYLPNQKIDELWHSGGLFGLSPPSNDALFMAGVKEVKGGSWWNVDGTSLNEDIQSRLVLEQNNELPQQVSYEERGGQDKTIISPFLGFRLMVKEVKEAK